MMGIQTRKMPKTFKTFNHLFKKKSKDRLEESLVSHQCSEPAGTANGKFIHSLIAAYYLVFQVNDHEYGLYVDRSK